MMVGVPMRFRTALFFLTISQLQIARTFDVGKLLSSVVEGLYNQIPNVVDRQEVSIQERPNDELSVMQEITSGRHGTNQAFHLFGLHDQDEEVIDLVVRHEVDEQEPQNIVDV